MINFFQRPAAGLSPTEAIEQHANGEIVVIDVRDPMELKASGTAAGAINIPLATFQMRVDPRSPECHDALKSGKPIAVFCASGGRSSQAKQFLEKIGYKDVHNIGGFGNWVQAGGPTE
ncbi:sulfurtransferase [Marivivens niveibacter]|uniref:Sulfurtransferase n=1 Tax=Marivivens niveibacter TaxID=1930667 RepID=A0A251WWW1_9RHOB|nr:rhodanese-like domain-containing protein [Marivivens niveibacter]OUD08635.1 sulfurtransferase [Marivivens niveibacter]